MFIMNFRSITKPKTIKVLESSDRYGRYSIEPYEKGFGITVGNALRRVLLSSVEGTAVVGVKISGASSEFDSIEGVLEDIVDIILNIKGLEINLLTKEPTIISINKKGKGPVTAADIRSDGNIEILNLDHHLLTLTTEREISLTFYVERGIGYVPSEELESSFDDVDIIKLDALFSPVVRVNYNVESARVGQSTDYDKLVFELETDSSVKPEDAIAFGAKIIKDHMDLFINFEEPEEVIEEAPEVENNNIEKLLNKGIDELELSVRANNCLKLANIKVLKELVIRTESDMLKTKNFGRKSLEEIKVILSTLGLSLGMVLEDDESNEDN